MVPIEMSQAYDCIPYELLLAKRKAYGFCLDGLNIVHSYLTNRPQRVKVNDTYSYWQKI